MWYEKSIFYHIYPLGFCGAPEHNDGISVNRINKISQWIWHMKKTGIDALYLGPVFESGTHGYDTNDYAKIDTRLGSNEDFAAVCKEIREAGIKVIIDGVFNHCGRGFWAFRDVLQKRHNSEYKDWFFINFDGNTHYNDGLHYEGWEGHYELVKLNLRNPQVKRYLFECIKGWIGMFGIDGLRLDVAYMLDRDFMAELRNFTKNENNDFFLLGETIHGNYNDIVNDRMLDSCTNYECFKGIFSSFNDKNMFEIAYSLNRQYGPEKWTLYKGKHLLSFVENHDVNRLASVLRDKKHVYAAYGLLFAMPGIPCVYYGGEWGAPGIKENGSDKNLRPCYSQPQENDLTRFISKLSEIRKKHEVFAMGDFKQIFVTSLQYGFAREYNGRKYFVLVNADSKDYNAPFFNTNFTAVNLFDNTEFYCRGFINVPAYGVMLLEIK